MSDSIGHFDPAKEDIGSWFCRFEEFLLTKDIIEPVAGADAATHAAALTTYNNKKRAWLNRLLGPTAHHVLVIACAPDLPTAKSFTDLKNILVTHYRPTRNKNDERDTYFNRVQKPNETVSEFALGLRSLARYCEFGDILDSFLQSQFINKLWDSRVKDKVRDGAVNFTTLVANAAKHESDLRPENPTPADVNYVRHNPQRRRKWKPPQQGSFQNRRTPRDSGRPTPPSTASSGSSGGAGQKVNARCFNCNDMGHFSRDCPRKRRQRKVMNVEDTTEELSHLDLSLVETPLPVLAVSPSAFPERLLIDVKVNNVQMKMEIDTGAKASVIGRSTYLQHFAEAPLRPTRALTWGAPMRMLGQFDAKVSVGEQTATVPLSVVDRDFPSLFGLPWLQHFKSLPFRRRRPRRTRARRLNLAVHGRYRVDRDNRETAVDACDDIAFGIRGPPSPEGRGRAGVPGSATDTNRSSSSDPESFGEAGIMQLSGAVYRRSLRYADTGRSTPTIDMLSLVEGEIFCLLDMDQAYLQAPLSPESQEMTKINTPFGSFKWLRMPFGIASGPSEFQEIITTILANIQNIFIYLDDILLWGSTRETCLKTLEEVLARLEKHNIRLNVKKCKLLVSEVKYLGFQLNRFGSRPDPQRIEELKQMPLPQNQYAPHLAKILYPFHRLVKSADRKWEDVEQKAYDKALSAIGSQILVPYSLNKRLRLTTDASPVGAGCVLSHVTEDEREQPVAFASKTFTDAEKNYPVHEREAAAMIFGLKKFNTFLEGREFELVTDNAALVALFGDKSKLRAYAAQRLRRWGLMLGAHRYTIVRHRSKDIPHADYLSRHPCADDTPVESEVYWVMSTEENILVSAEEVASATAADPVLRRVRGYVQEGWPDRVTDEDLKPYHRRYLQLTVENGCVLWGVRVVMPATLRSRVLELLHETHPGVTRMTALARGYVWYPYLDADIEQKVRDCAVCRTLQVEKPHEQLVPWSWPTRRWQRVYIDFADYRGAVLLLGQDGHSKWPEVQILPNKTAATTVEALRTWFARWGLPEEVVADNGPPFASNEFKTFLEAHGVTLTHSPSFHPASNGQIERSVQSVKACLEKQLLDNASSARSLQHKIDSWLFAYRNTSHSVTKVTPAELFLGRRPRTKLSLVKPDQILKKRMARVGEKTKQDNPGSTSVFRPGDLVWVRSVVHRRILWLRGTVEAPVSLVSYEVAVNGKVRHVSTTHLSPRSPSATSFEGDPVARLFAPPVPETSIPDAPVVPVPGLPAPEEPSVVRPSSPPPGPPLETTPRVPEAAESPVVPQPVIPSSSRTTTPRAEGPSTSLASPPRRLTSMSTPTRSTTTFPSSMPPHVSRAGRRIVMPKHLSDFVPK
ncbi:uncharacterized protein LOC108737207 [Agrilus planipennis]|uniref:RNA-directed DNA polymerase n=1 Tax=Agrilus planipennis TaxID=224129 RepID=A0A1W4WZ57_AGRPL|nr:uncharacterized protein LOC108737207 [Agrilus planipennis]